MTRVVETSSTVVAGCFDCKGSTAIWTTKNALALAARHHDTTGHMTWAQQSLFVRYGTETATHPDLFQESA